jgi:hypothetical protein
MAESSFASATAAVVKARNTSMIATVPVARVAPFEKAVDRDFHRQTKRRERDRNLYHGLWQPHRVIFDHLGNGSDYCKPRLHRQNLHVR